MFDFDLYDFVLNQKGYYSSPFLHYSVAMR